MQTDTILTAPPAPLEEWWPDTEKPDKEYGRPNPGSLEEQAASNPAMRRRIEAGRREAVRDERSFYRWGLADCMSGMQVL